MENSLDELNRKLNTVQERINELLKLTQRKKA